MVKKLTWVGFVCLSNPLHEFLTIFGRSVISMDSLLETIEETKIKYIQIWRLWGLRDNTNIPPLFRPLFI